MLHEPLNRVVSGMRPTGKLHLGHYHSVLKNWVFLQDVHECFYFVADWHALTTDYKDLGKIEEHVWEMIFDWLIAGVDPEKATIYIQSQVPEHAELNLLLSMVTPLGWLERVPSYKDQLKKLSDRELDTHGFLGYPVLQAADILLYRASYVPVGEDQVPHVELTREIARRVNHIFGKKPDHHTSVERALLKLPEDLRKRFNQVRTAYLQEGDETHLEEMRLKIQSHRGLTLQEQELLVGDLRDQGVSILVEPQALLTEIGRVPGTDGQKMSKSYQNTIDMRDDPKRIEKKILGMPTDPNRKRLKDPGDPTKCPVWLFHKLYSSDELKEHINTQCRNAGIGCVECKKHIVGSIIDEQKELSQRAKDYQKDRSQIRNIVADGCERAREVAADTISELRRFLNIDYY